MSPTWVHVVKRKALYFQHAIGKLSPAPFLNHFGEGQALTCSQVYSTTPIIRILSTNGANVELTVVLSAEI